VNTRLIESTVETSLAIARGTADYWTGALARGATPFDVGNDMLRWWDAMADRRPPTWSSPNEVVLDRPGLAMLRDFSAGSRARVKPTLVLPPQAGHHSSIVDYSASQSQISVIRAVGLERVWSMEWVGATPATRDAMIEDYIAFLDDAVELIGEPVNLIGDCQGGWLAAIYAALRPDAVNTLTVAGAPIDFHAGDGPIHEWVSMLCAAGGMSFYEGLVASGGGVLPGKYLLDGFIVIKPENEVSKQFDLLLNLDDDLHLARYRDFEDWFKYTQDLPGDFYLWIVRELFRDNKLIAGDLEVCGEPVDLSNIAVPLFLLAGETDHITPPPQVFEMERHVSSTEVVERTTSGGHLGLFMGREALRDHWPPILAGVLEHSRSRAPKARAASRARGRTRAAGRTIPAP
jgi:poly(3-hydroxybutyrate) depolymerase